MLRSLLEEMPVAPAMQPGLPFYMWHMTVASQQSEEARGQVLPLFAPIVARQPLTIPQWRVYVPTPCNELPELMPAVLARSELEAVAALRHLPPAHSARLRATLLCLNRVQRGLPAALPTQLVERMLVVSVLP